MNKPKTVTVYLRVCKYYGYDVHKTKKEIDDRHILPGCCRIIPYKLKVPKK